MFMLDLFVWWYGNGWTGVLRATRRRLAGLGAAFSTATLLKTLFAPWKRIITYPGSGLDAKLRALGDNLISRFVGFMVRIVVLLAALISLIGLCLIGLAELVVWPLLPLAAVALIVKGLL
jgi:hypothetical protein